MSILESTRKMTTNEKMCYDMGYAQGKQDTVPVVHGEWVVDECDTTDDVPSSSWIDFHCSECNTDYGLEEGQYGWCRYEKIPYQYCPYCGAKMDKEDKHV
jgi:hypothetical protein